MLTVNLYVQILPNHTMYIKNQALSPLIFIYHIPAVPFVQRPPFRRLHMSYLNAFVVSYYDPIKYFIITQFGTVSKIIIFMLNGFTLDNNII